MKDYITGFLLASGIAVFFQCLYIVIPKIIQMYQDYKRYKR
jgi:hypothetical protein